MGDTMRRRTAIENLKVLAATSVALAPGFVVPFLVALRLPKAESDSLFLGYSILVFLVGVVGTAVEATSLAEFSRNEREVYSSDRSFRRYILRLSVTLVLTSVTGAPVLVFLYGFHAGLGRILPFALPFAVAGTVAGISAFFGAVLIGAGQICGAVLTQILRSAPAIIFLLLANAPDPVVTAWLFVLGEALRAVALAAMSTKVIHRRRDAVSTQADWNFNGALWQMASTCAGQATPVIDRWFLSAGGAGSVTAYELADKLYYVGYQLITMGLLPGRIARWGKIGDAREPGSSPANDLRKLFVVSACVAPAIGVPVSIALWSGLVPSAWATGALWSLIMILSLPFGVVQVVAVRLLIAMREQKRLLPMTAVGLTCNLCGNAIFFALAGPVGVVVSTVLTRFVVAAVFTVVSLRLYRKVSVHAQR